MKTKLLLCLALLFSVFQTVAQDDSPYARFGYEGKVLRTPQERQQRMMLLVPNTDTASAIAKVGLDPANQRYYLFDKQGHISIMDTLSATQVARFLSVDPLADSFPWNSTYAFAEGDVIRSIDLDGLEKVIYLYNFTSDKITKTKIELPKAGPLGNGVLISTNHNGNNAFFYGKELSSSSITGFKKHYEGAKINKSGEHVLYNDSKGNPTIGYGHLVKPGEAYKAGSTISEKVAQTLFEADTKTIKSAMDKKLAAYELNSYQSEALLDAAFNLGPGRLSKYKEDGTKFSGEFFFLKFMGDPGIKKRRYAENLLYDEGIYLGLEPVRGKSAIQKASSVVKDATQSVSPQPIPAGASTTEDKTPK